MITFGRGTGVEFIPEIDPDARRAAFFAALIAGNRLELKIPQMFSHMMRDGRILLELYPNGYSHRAPYRIKHYRPKHYRIEHDEYDDPTAVKYCYPYRAIEAGANQARTKWAVLRVTSQLIEIATVDNEPDLDQVMPAGATASNPLGFMPYVEVLNPPPAGGELGESDFAQIATHLDNHNEVTDGIVDKIIEFSCNPIVTNKPASEMTAYENNGQQSNDFINQINSVAYASGFSLGTTPPNPRRRKLKKFFGDFESEDRIEQLQINPVPQDHVVWADGYERQLREALGGILERGIETATESRVVYGKVLATAKDKQTALFKYGLCEIFSFALLAEEAVYMATGGIQGLAPQPNRAVNYRVGAVFMPTADDTLKRSIVGRNLTEHGMSARETLKWIFPEKTETEIDQMVSAGGVPIRYLTQVMQMFSQASTLINPVDQLPYLDPTTGGTIAESFLPFILNALSYGSQFNSTPGQSGANSERYQPAAVAAAIERVRGRGSADPMVSADNQQPTGSDDAGPGTTPGPLPGPGTTRRAGGNLPGFFDLTRSPVLNYFGFGGQ